MIAQKCQERKTLKNANCSVQKMLLKEPIAASAMIIARRQAFVLALQTKFLKLAVKLNAILSHLKNLTQILLMTSSAILLHLQITHSTLLNHAQVASMKWVANYQARAWANPKRHQQFALRDFFLTLARRFLLTWKHTLSLQGKCLLASLSCARACFVLLVLSLLNPLASPAAQHGAAD